MKYILLAIINMFVTIYFAKKRWYAASLVFACSILVLTGLLLFTVEIPTVTDGFIEIVGLETYNIVGRILSANMYYAFPPFAAIVILCLLSVFIVALKTIEHVVNIVKAHYNHRFARSARTTPPPEFCAFLGNSNRKLYLSNCALLC